MYAAIPSLAYVQFPSWGVPKQRLTFTISPKKLWAGSFVYVMIAGHEMQAFGQTTYARISCAVKTRHSELHSCSTVRNDTTMIATKRCRWTDHFRKYLYAVRCAGVIVRATNTVKKGVWRALELKRTIAIISPTVISFVQATAQSDRELEMEFVISSGELILLFTVFGLAVAGVCIFLARDIILRKKTLYDSKEFESKKDKTYEKYHSGWGDDYEEVGTRKNTSIDEEFRKAAQNSELPDYYKVLGLPRDATQEDIKKQYRVLAKKSHPDKTGHGGSKEIMAGINEAYEVLSDQETRAKYDGFLD